MKRLADENGQALIIAVLCMGCLIGFVAFATDVGIMLREKRLAQVAADSAAIAGATELNYALIDGTTAATVAKADASKNGFTDTSGVTTITVNNPPKSGPYGSEPGGSNSINYVEVIVSQVQPTIFMRLFNRSSMTVAARAVATNNATTTGCVYTLGTSGTDLGITGNADVQVTTCGININSSSNSAMALTGNVTLDAKSIGIVGGYSDNGNINLTPSTPTTNIVPTSDPLAFLPTPVIPKTCSADPALNGNNTQTISQGCFTGLSASGNSALTLNPGTYVINGNFSITGNASITGTGVTLVLEGSTTLTGNISLNLSAPTSGADDGLLLDQPSSNHQSIQIVGNAGSVLKGIVYAPNGDVSLTGNSGSSIYSDFVVKTLSLVGNSSFQSYASINGGSILSSVKLVE